MATILLVWEFGGGLGHLQRLLSLGQVLEQRGHRLALACREPGRAARYGESRGMRLPTLAVPALSPVTPIQEPANYAEILVQFGIDQAEVLRGVVQAWHALLAAVQPDLAVMDFSPLALLALQGHPARRVLYGTGFACPPCQTPLPVIRTWQSHYPDRLMMNEEALLESFNRVLGEHRQPPLAYFAELFGRVDLSLLATFPELDHYPERASGDYSGHWTMESGAAPGWRGRSSRRAFAYLRDIPLLPHLLSLLERRDIATLLYVPGLTEAGAARHQSALTTITREPVAMGEALSTADLAILHGGHGATAESLLAGVPVLALPVYAEQLMTANRITHQGYGLHANVDDPDSIAAALDAMLGSPRFEARAAAFAASHSGREPVSALADVADRIETVLAGVR